MNALTKSAVALVVLGCAWTAQAQYAAKVTVNSGNSFVVKQLNIKNDRLFSDTGQASTSLSMIQAVEFRFAGINLKMCEKMFQSGDRKSLESLLLQNMGSVMKFSYLPGNLGDYLLWLVRVQYWNDNAAGIEKTLALIQQTNNPEYMEPATLYQVMLLLDQGKLADAKNVFSSVGNPNAISEPMAEYIRGKIALVEGDPRAAMQCAARIIAFHSRDPEWMAPATGLEALIYQQMGQLNKAEIVANELMMAYPGTRWSKLGEKIKKESTGTHGG
jgi:hypothetical protein